MRIESSVRVIGHGHLGRGHMGHTRMRLAGMGDPGDELFLLFDGVLAVEQDGQQVAEVARGRRDGGSGGLKASPPVDGGSGGLKASPPVDGG